MRKLILVSGNGDRITGATVITNVEIIDLELRKKIVRVITKVAKIAVQAILLTALFIPMVAGIIDNTAGTNFFSFFQRNTTEMGFAFRELIIFLAVCIFSSLTSQR
ncbi:MAG: hypothetical protein NTY31_00290 [Candidatus Falkowbacteria bacterium]|nr:hypothetical protein [Candidatus Falkowbacteria bacterium]